MLGGFVHASCVTSLNKQTFENAQVQSIGDMETVIAIAVATATTGIVKNRRYLISPVAESFGNMSYLEWNVLAGFMFVEARLMGRIVPPGVDSET